MGLMMTQRLGEFPQRGPLRLRHVGRKRDPITQFAERGKSSGIQGSKMQNRQGILLFPLGKRTQMLEHLAIRPCVRGGRLGANRPQDRGDIEVFIPGFRRPTQRLLQLGLDQKGAPLRFIAERTGNPARPPSSNLARQGSRPSKAQRVVASAFHVANNRVDGSFRREHDCGLDYEFRN